MGQIPNVLLFLLDGKEALVAVGSTGKTKRPQTSAKFTGNKLFTILL